MQRIETTDRLGNSAFIRATVDLGNRETGCRFSPFYDAFHLPFPCRTEELVTTPFDVRNHPGAESSERHESAGWRSTHRSDAEDGTRISQNSLTGLPAEVLDLVLSHLTPTALDAARFTCKSLRRKIMNNRWVLSAVTRHDRVQSSRDRRLLDRKGAGREDVPSVEADSDGNVALRDLLKSFDRQSDLMWTHGDSGTWRTRFRVRNFEFLIAEAHDDLTPTSTTFRLRSAVRTGSHLGCMVLQIVACHKLPIVAPPSKSILLFFLFDTDDYPLYAGSAEHPGGKGTMDPFKTAGSKFRCSWMLKVRIDGQLRYYSINPRGAFSNSEARFRVTELEDARAAQQIDGLIDGEFISSSCGSITNFPRAHLARRLVLSDATTLVKKGRYVSDHISPDDLFVEDEDQYPGKPQQSLDCVISHSNCEGHCSGLANLLRPYQNCIVRNIAIAPILTSHGTLRVAIIWQSKNDDDRRLELYVYDVPEASAKGGELAFLEVSAKAADSFPGYQRVQGKRVTSLGPRIGGIHPLSQTWDLEATQATKRALEEENALGGLQLPQSSGSYPQSVQYQKCFVWGPVTKGEAISVEWRIFDFQFADPQRLDLIVSANEVPITELQDPWRYIPAINRNHCACALHDDGFHIVLPPIEQLLKSSQRVQDKSEKTSSSSFWPWKFRITPKVDEPMPVAYRNDSIARQAALDRETEWYRERIRGMRKAGLSDLDIAELWGCSRWTQYGQVRKPDGWHKL